MSFQIGLPRQIDEKPHEACDCPPFVFLDFGIEQGSLHVFAEDDRHWETVCSVFSADLCAQDHFLTQLEMYFSPF